MNNPNLKKLEREIVPITTSAEKLVITSEKDMSIAAEHLSQINRYTDTLTEEKEKITKPLNTALKAARTLFGPLESKLKEAALALRAGVSEYQTHLMNKKREAEQKIADDLGSSKIKKVVTAVKRMQEVEAPPQSVETDSGSTKFRPSQRLKITDVAALPRLYLVPNEKLLLEALKAGTKIPGAEIEIIQVPINYR